jgi:hypothetical protein
MGAGVKNSRTHKFDHNETRNQLSRPLNLDFEIITIKLTG